MVGLVLLILSIYLGIYSFQFLFKTTGFPILDEIWYPKDMIIIFCLYFLTLIIGSIGLILLKKWGRITLIITSIFSFVVLFFMEIDNISYFEFDKSDVKVIIYLLIFLFLIIFLLNKDVIRTIDYWKKTNADLKKK